MSIKFSINITISINISINISLTCIRSLILFESFPDTSLYDSSVSSGLDKRVNICSSLAVSLVTGGGGEKECLCFSSSCLRKS